jgi:EAL domain-containing protein (putative c-di-GMP-specific phosphodiesterase class I)
MDGLPATPVLVTAERLQPAPSIRRILTLARTHLGMDRAVLVAFTGSGEMVGVLDGQDTTLQGEAELPVDPGRCRLLIEEELPLLVTNVSRQRPATAPGPRVGAYVAAPVRLPDGSPFGLLCCLARKAHPGLDEGSLRLIRLLAAVAGEAVGDQEALPLERRLDTIEATLGAIREGGMRLVYQPVFRLRTGEPVGFEALARFPGDPRRPPRSWFWGARQVGLAIDLEFAALRRALDALDAIPEPLYLSVNLFSETLVSADLADLFADVPPGRVVLELAEHERLADSRSLVESVETLRRLGARFAVDDVGSGFSSLRHVMRIRPEILKLDLNLTHQVDRDPMQRMLVSSLSRFAAEAGMVPGAVGVESSRQLEALRRLGVVYGQGHLLGRPHPEPTVPGLHTGLPWETPEAAS